MAQAKWRAEHVLLTREKAAVGVELMSFAGNLQGCGEAADGEGRQARGAIFHSAPARKMLLVNSCRRWSSKRQYGEFLNSPAVSFCRAYTPGKNRFSNAAMLVTPPVTPSS